MTREAPHYPRRGDDVERWLKRERDRYVPGGELGRLAVDYLLDRYRECADYGATLDDEGTGDP